MPKKVPVKPKPDGIFLASRECYLKKVLFEQHVSFDFTPDLGSDSLDLAFQVF